MKEWRCEEGVMWTGRDIPYEISEDGDRIWRDDKEVDAILTVAKEALKYYAEIIGTQWANKNFDNTLVANIALTKIEELSNENNTIDKK